MTAGITFEELLAWNCESADLWKAHFEANPALLELPCGIAGALHVQALVRHIWGAELIWSQRLAGLPPRNKNDWPAGPLEALYDLHREAVDNFRAVLANPATDWVEPLAIDYFWLPAEAPRPTPRKLLAHALIHSHRHWAQLITLARQAGFPPSFMGDVLFSAALD